VESALELLSTDLSHLSDMFVSLVYFWHDNARLKLIIQSLSLSSKAPVRLQNLQEINLKIKRSAKTLLGPSQVSA